MAEKWTSFFRGHEDGYYIAQKNGIFGWVESYWHCVSDTIRRHIVFLQKSNYQSPNFSYFQYKYTIFLYYCKK